MLGVLPVDTRKVEYSGSPLLERLSIADLHLETSTVLPTQAAQYRMSVVFKLLPRKCERLSSVWIDPARVRVRVRVS